MTETLRGDYQRSGITFKEPFCQFPLYYVDNCPTEHTPSQKWSTYTAGVLLLVLLSNYKSLIIFFSHFLCLPKFDGYFWTQSNSFAASYLSQYIFVFQICIWSIAHRLLNKFSLRLSLSLSLHLTRRIFFKCCWTDLAQADKHSFF